jgi:starch-binding outer membrane protein, SusD/RagB family
MNKYKSKISIALAFSTALFWAGCSDKDLEIKPSASTDEKAFFSDPTRIAQVVNSAYNNLGSGDFLGGNVQTVNELWSDNAFTSAVSVGGGLNYYKHIVGDIFNDSYNAGTLGGFGKVCRDANLAILGCEKYGDNLDANTKKRLLAEAKFLKAIAHFETVRLFGQPWGFTADNSHLGIGIRKNIDEATVARVSVKEVYEYAIAQINEALPDLAVKTGASTTATRAIAKGYLAKIYFQQNRYQDALTMATEALNESAVGPDSLKYRFSDSPKAAFSGALFSLTANVLSTGGGVYKGFGLSDTYGFNASAKPIPSVMMSQELANLLGSTDTMKVRWLRKTSTPDGTGYILTKVPIAGTRFDMNILHWAELKLIKAECMAELNQTAAALVELNDVRTAHSFFALGSVTNTPSLITSIRNQRRIEMMGEGNRMQDLKRIGAASARGLTQAAENNLKVRNAPWNCVGMVVQVPSSEHAASPNFPFNPTGSCN